MKRKVDYDVRNKPSKERLGLTFIYERVWDNQNQYTDTVLGKLTKERSKPYTAITFGKDDTEVVVGQFETRSQGGHAIRKQYRELHGTE